MRIPLWFTQNFRVAVTRIQNLRFYETLQKGILALPAAKKLLDCE